MNEFLASDIKFLKGVGSTRAEVLQKELGIFCFADLINHYPFRYVDRSKFYKISEIYPDKLKLKFTRIPNIMKIKRPIYTKLLKDDYLRGNDSGEALEYRYFLRKYPELEKYMEHSWTFNVDGNHLNYSEVKSRAIHYKFKYMKCLAGRKSIVIDENLNAYRCNDYYYSKIQPIHISKLNFIEFLSKDIRCLSCKCTDGFDHMKYK